MDIKELREKIYSERKDPNFKSKNADIFKNYKIFDTYQEAFDKREELILEGDLVLGALVMANGLLFDKDSKYHCPGVMIYSHDEYFEDNPEELVELASDLYELRELDDEDLFEGNEMEDYYRKEIADKLNAEEVAFFNYSIPEFLTEGRKVYMTSIFFMRNDLKDNVLSSRLYPIFVKKGIKGATILSYKYYDYDYKIEEEFKARKFLQIAVPIVGLALFAVSSMLQWKIISILIFLFIFIFTFFNWRCPKCKGFLGKGSNPKYCPHCSVKLK